MIHFVSSVCLLRGEGGGKGFSHSSETDGDARPSPSRAFALVDPGEMTDLLLIVIYQDKEKAELRTKKKRAIH